MLCRYSSSQGYQHPGGEPSSSSHVGIDYLAWRWEHRYGMLIVNLDTQCQRRMKSDPLISPPTAQY
ncbi:hypothetical protein FYA20_07755 [Escherichia coli O2:H6]|nr:hypothetical protein [Escherichia coli]QEI83500.1 hypothetical protein FYA20_07755 [Escherichia coli O2:H6]KAA9237906.1 hypothetical protein F6I43_18735 [Escherichia coli]MBW9763429.1 hypothetical protein [Escherichia coli]MBW9976578.1 hypothetical protein [Escherichia coli]